MIIEDNIVPKTLYIRASTVNTFLTSDHNIKSVYMFDDFLKSNWEEYNFIPIDIDTINSINELEDDKLEKQKLINIVKNFNVSDNTNLHIFIANISTITKNKKIQKILSKFAICQFGINMEDTVINEYCKISNKKLLYSNISLNNKLDNEILYENNKKKYKTIVSNKNFILKLIGTPDGITENNEILEIKTRTRKIGELKPENIDQVKSYLEIYDLDKGYLVEALIKNDYNYYIPGINIPSNITLKITEILRSNNFINNINFKINSILAFTLNLYKECYNNYTLDEKLITIKLLYKEINLYILINNT